MTLSFNGELAGVGGINKVAGIIDQLRAIEKRSDAIGLKLDPL
jgi:hypothetical protein